MNEELTGAFPDLKNLEPEAAQTLAAAARLVSIPAGSVLFQEGSECNSYVLVFEGSIRVQKVSESGREIVLYRVERGQSCVLTTNCLIARDEYSAEGLAETEVRAMVLPAPTFRSLLGASEVFRDLVFSAYASRIAGLLMLIEEVAFGRIDTRLAAWLSQRSGGGDIRATHQDIATELGTAREVISRQLKEFERHGWLTLHRGRIDILDNRALARLSAGL